MKITLHYTDEQLNDSFKEFELGGGTELSTFIKSLTGVSYFHNTTNTIWRIRGVKDGKDSLLGYFVTDRNKHHKYATPFDGLQLTQLGDELYAAGEKFESLNVDSLDFLKLFNEMKEKDQIQPQSQRSEIKKFDRVISEKIRFGYGFRTVDGNRQYYAWHGLPNKNDNFITTAEITEAEFHMIESEYPRPIDNEKNRASVFRRKYVHGHKMLLEGWNTLI